MNKFLTHIKLLFQSDIYNLLQENEVKHPKIV